MKTVWQKGPDLRDERGIYHYEGRDYTSVTTALSGHGDLVWVHAHAVSSLVNELHELRVSRKKYVGWDRIEFVDDDGVVSERWEKIERDPLDVLSDGAYISKAGFRFLKRCADRGELLHDMLEDYARGVQVNHEDKVEVYEYSMEKLYGSGMSVDEDEYTDMAYQLLCWLHTARPDIIFSEVPAFNDEEQYAGRIDAVAYIGDELYVLDLKSSTDYKRVWGAQVGAYKHAEFYLVSGGARGMWLEVEMPAIDKAGIIMLDRSRCFLRTVDNVDLAYTDLFLPSLKAAKAARKLPLPSKSKSFLLKS